MMFPWKNFPKPKNPLSSGERRNINVLLKEGWVALFIPVTGNKEPVSHNICGYLLFIS